MTLFKRQTKVNAAVQKTLKNQEGPVSMETIKAQLKKQDLQPNKTTLYRILDTLREGNHVQEIRFQNGITYYEWVTSKQQHHHHHFYCQDCDVITCLNPCHLDHSETGIKSLLPNESYKVSHHEFNMIGTCPKCA